LRSRTAGHNDQCHADREDDTDVVYDTFAHSGDYAHSPVAAATDRSVSRSLALALSQVTIRSAAAAVDSTFHRNVLWANTALDCCAL
jgi:hypothetical protein